MTANRVRTTEPLPRPPGCPPMEIVRGAEIAERFAGHLADESRSTGSAETLAFPRCEADICEMVRRSAAEGTPVTVSAGRTGIVAGTVPPGGCALSTERMDSLRIERDADGDWAAVCGPGLTLEGLTGELAGRPERLFFPPDPTETTARIGGIVAANASGSRSYRWGATRRYVKALRLVLACGEVLALRRGQCLAGPGGFELELAGGAVLAVPVPGIEMPAGKSAAGYYAAPGMDMVDLFVGSEGTLGVISEAALKLEDPPEVTLSLLGFFPEEGKALDFVRALRGERSPHPAPPEGLQAIEYFDGRSLDLLRGKRAEELPDSEIPELPARARAAVLVEVGCTAAEEEGALDALAALLDEFGSDAEEAWAGLEERERSRLAAFRHALPEAVNSIIGRTQREFPGLTKVGTDMAVPAAALGAMMEAYARVLGGSGLRHLVFGHIGQNHLHANVLPADMEEYARARELYMELARRAVELGGTVAAEHGIGKLKKPLLDLMYGPEGVEEMRRTRRALDPGGLLGPGTLFDM